MDSLSRHDEYEGPGLLAADLDADPFVQFASWLSDAESARITEPNAMVLSTIDSDGRPSSRTVLLKGLLETADGTRFEFVTNGDSRKGRALAGDSRVALVFPWYPLRRQVIVEGVATRADEALSDRYWATRPRGSQLGGWASAQSRPIADRESLERQLAAVEERFAEAETVPRPPHWGAWLVEASAIEFWQGRRSRLHDRLVYRPTGPRHPDAGAPAAWTIERLQP